mgnify:CR=1 FL=1
MKILILCICFILLCIAIKCLDIGIKGLFDDYTEWYLKWLDEKDEDHK